MRHSLTVAQLYMLSPEVNSPSLFAPEPGPTLQQNPVLADDSLPTEGSGWSRPVPGREPAD